VGFPSTPPRAFISYARKDSRDLALRLRDNLQAAGYEAWIDTSEIAGGASWSHEIEQAIERCDVALALLSAGSFGSEICRAEQLRALRKGRRVIPLLVQAEAERPLHLEHLNYCDFSNTAQYKEKFQALLTDIATGKVVPLPEKHRQTLVTVPPMPVNLIPRPKEVEALRRAAIGDDSKRHIALTSLRGMGGIGKTVLAQSLCHDEIVQAAFPDGVIWVTIGREPGDLVRQMREVGKALGGRSEHYDTPEASINRLRTLLQNKAVLIVLDDVWDACHVEPFRVDALRCRLLFTTRDGSIGLSLGAEEVKLGVLTPGQAVTFLREWAGREDPAIRDIAERLGYLPLALKLAGARLREGMSGAEWLETFQHVLQMKLGRRSDNPQENLQLCFDLSVERLPDKDRTLYCSLGIFPEDIGIPRTTIARLWQRIDSELSAFDCREVVTDLARLELYFTRL
jgi:TIR domain-containing protein/NB-ARC domain-containing protein